MPPKASKKTVEKQKQKIIEDKTFGLKNKNRSAKVQAYVNNVSQSVRSSNRTELKAQMDLEAKKRAKEEKKAFEAAMQKLFHDDGKKKNGGSDSEDEEGEEAEENEETDRNLGADPNDYLWTADDFDEVEFDPGRLEEILEAERAKLVGRTDLTPVTEESFLAWKLAQKARKEEKERKRLDAAKAGKGKLKGWDLWNQKKELFVDDEDGEEVYAKEFDDAALFEDGDEQQEFDLGDEGGAAAAAAASGGAAAAADGGDAKGADGEKKAEDNQDDE